MTRSLVRSGRVPIVRHLPGQHNQKSHGHGGGGASDDWSSATELPDPKAVGLMEYGRAVVAQRERFGEAYADWRGDLTVDEAGALQHWGGSSSGIAAHLRGQPGTVTRADIEAIPHLDSAISKSSIPGDMTVYRGLRGRHDAWVGTTVRDECFTATSISRSEARNFAGSSGTMVAIKVRKGQPGAYLGGVASGHAFEKEILLPRRSSFRVTGSHEEGGRLVLDAEYVP